MKRQFVWAMTIAVAVLAAACDGAEDSAGLGPSASAVSNSQGLTAAQSATLSAACGAFGSGDRVTTPGAQPPGTPPPDARTGGPGGRGPGDTVTTPGAQPPATPATGAQLAIGGAVEGVAGSCPALTFRIGGKNVRTDATTSFGSGSCASLKNGDRVGAQGTALADGSIAAACVAGI